MKHYFPILGLIILTAIVSSFTILSNQVDYINLEGDQFISLQFENSRIYLSEKQDTSDVTVYGYLKVDRTPTFPKCGSLEREEERKDCFSNQMHEHIIKTFRYPPQAKDNGVEGKVFIMIVFGADGEVSSLSVARSVDPHLDEEALRIFSLLPRMIPAELNGERVSVSIIIPINFKLQ
jgi:periplasmic protein TonB